MKTDELITTLSKHPPNNRTRFGPTVTVVIATIVALMVVLMLSLEWLKPRPDFYSGLAAHNHVFLLKLVFTLGVVAGAVPIVRDLSVPGRRVGWGAVLTAVPFVVIMLLALRELAALPVDEWSHHLDYSLWFECLWQISALAVPALIILAFAVRRLAPTNLVRSGAYIGLLAGSMGALGYALHCHDDDIAFVAFAYTSAILEMTLIGAVMGQRALRWT